MVAASNRTQRVLVGGPDFVIEVTVSPGNLILEMSMPGAGIELLEPWG